MPESQYETLPDTVLAYKKDHKIGRFDPAAPEIQERKVREMWKEVEERSESRRLSSTRFQACFRLCSSLLSHPNTTLSI